MFWTQDSGSTNSSDSLILEYSSQDFVNGTWSVPQVFTNGDSFAASQASTSLSSVISKDLSNLGNPPTNCCSTTPSPTPTPPPTPCLTCSPIIITPASSEDPNGKIGPVGFGSANWVSDGAALPYTIDFENSTNATAPAQVVNISDPLSSNFDWTTFELSEISFGDQFIPIPPNSLYFATNIDMSYRGVDFVVKIEAGIDLATGEVFANFTSIDPLTDLPPPVNVGFLPPEDGTGRGTGHVTFFIQPQPHLPTGTQITNVAFIQFDENPVIGTDQVNDEDPSRGVDPNKMAIVEIDNSSPYSSVMSLPYVSTNANFAVCWAGTNNGPPIVTYDIYVSTNSGPWTLWLEQTTNTCVDFLGAAGNSYGFYSIAYDGAGEVQAAPAATTASTILATHLPPQFAPVANQSIAVGPGPRFHQFRPGPRFAPQVQSWNGRSRRREHQNQRCFQLDTFL